MKSVVDTPRAVAAGQRPSTASANHDVIPVGPKQRSSDLAWREGALIFDGKPPSEAVAEIERYTDTRITIGDPVSASLLVSGPFRTGERRNSSTHWRPPCRSPCGRRLAAP